MQCWGDNSWGQVGDGTSGTTRTVPTTVCASGSVATSNCVIFTAALQASIAPGHVCATTTNAMVYCWGTNNESELAMTADANNHPNPVLISAAGFAGRAVTKITAGAYSVCALSADNTGSYIKCWGFDTDGQLGSGSVAAGNINATPTAVCTTASCAGSAYLTGVTDVTNGNWNANYTTCAIASSAVYCWGSNVDGQMGLGSADANTHPYAVPSLVTSASSPTSVVTFGLTTCALIQKGGTMRCWGQNGPNALIGTGDTTTANILMPTAQSW
jgi:alpha-tubulin suppressor-like RCC1 family protein